MVNLGKPTIPMDGMGNIALRSEFFFVPEWLSDGFDMFDRLWWNQRHRKGARKGDTSPL